MKYFKLLTIFYKNTLISELEYRVNFWSNLGVSVFWLVWAAISVRVYFFQTDEIAGWSYPELLIVMGLFFALNGFRQLILTPNLSRLSEYVRLGTLDYVLTKPVNSQFMVSLRNIGVYNWGDPMLGLALAGVGLWQVGHTPTLSQWALFAAISLAACLLLYSISLILQTTTFWLVSVDRVDALVFGLIETGRFPVNFYRGVLRALLTFVFPVAFMTTFPAEALLGRLNGGWALAAFGLAGGFFIAASLFWRFALRFYSGASS